jgi:hypothetical protein
VVGGASVCGGAIVGGKGELNGEAGFGVAPSALVSAGGGGGGKAMLGGMAGMRGCFCPGKSVTLPPFTLR